MKYQNPILRGFHPDPSICRVGGDYYLAVSSFEYFPGIPLYHSRDLVNWTQIGNCLQRAEEFPLLKVGDSGGIWAPTVRYESGLFYVTAALEGYGNFIITSADPAGEWSAPVWLPEVGGIDPSLYFEDGHAYYCTNDPLDEKPAISMQEVDTRTGRVIGARRVLWRGTGAPYLEAPHLYRIWDRYYILAAEGGTGFTHMETVARSGNLWGPYENCPDNPILTSICDRGGEVLCAGHGDLIEDTCGNWWMVHLGTRDACCSMTHLGRETFLTPVMWENGWPRCGHDRHAALSDEGPLTVPQKPPAAFIADTRRSDWEPEWIFLRRPDMNNFRHVQGSLILTPTAAALRDPVPTFVGVRPLDFECEVRTVFTFDPKEEGDEAGLAVRQSMRFHIACTVGLRAGQRVLTLALELSEIRHVIARHPIPAGDVTVVMTADRSNYAFACTVGGSMFEVGRVSTRFLTVEFTGSPFTGNVIGLYATSRSKAPNDMRVTYFGMFPSKG